MKIRTLSFVTTALSLSMTPLYAQDNNAYLDQLGLDNSALVDQGDGSGNRAGGKLDESTGGTLIVNEMTQNGNNNDLDIVQSGDGNWIGVQRRGSAGGLDQNGNGNSAEITQSSNNNFVNVILQDSTAGTAANALTITQSSSVASQQASGNPLSGDGNLLSAVRQTNTGAVVNTATISQNVSTAGTSRYRRNQIGGPLNMAAGTIFRDSNLNQTGNGVTQTGSGNTLTLTQDGGSNVIVTASQVGDANLASVSQNGNRNGKGGLTANLASGTGAVSSSVIQGGSDNVVDYSATGDDNQFGFSQFGNRNTVGAVTVIGLGNQTSAYQDGEDNVVSISPIVGDDNDVGAIQIGDLNEANVSMTNGSDRNSVGIYQTGNQNLATATIDGDDNGSGLFSGDALSVGLTSGLITQLGDLNEFDGSITGNSNEFAALQDGISNVVTASVTGDSNQFAVSQVGDANTAVVTQLGNGNNAGIMQ